MCWTEKMFKPDVSGQYDDGDVSSTNSHRFELP